MTAARKMKPAKVRLDGPIVIVTERDDLHGPPEPSGDPEYAQADADERAAWERGEWHWIAIYARAKVIVCGTVQTIESAGLFGIESNSGADYLESVAREEHDALTDILHAIGVRDVPPFGPPGEDGEG